MNAAAQIVAVEALAGRVVTEAVVVAAAVVEAAAAAVVVAAAFVVVVAAGVVVAPAVVVMAAAVVGAAVVVAAAVVVEAVAEVVVVAAIVVVVAAIVVVAAAVVVVVAAAVVVDVADVDVVAAGQLLLKDAAPFTLQPNGTVVIVVAVPEHEKLVAQSDFVITPFRHEYMTLLLRLVSAQEPSSRPLLSVTALQAASEYSVIPTIVEGNGIAVALHCVSVLSIRNQKTPMLHQHTTHA